MLRCRLISLIFSAAIALGLLRLPVSGDQEQDTQHQKVATETVLAAPQIEPVASIPAQTGTASWYGGSFVGRKTASGERYRPNERTAAHRTLAFGAFVRVTNLRNKKSAVVRINNRGPYIKGRIIDLSRQAAADLGIVKTGIARVHVEVLSKEAAVAALAAL